MVVLGAQELTVADAARLAGLTPSAVRHRLRIGWPIGQASTEPCLRMVGDGRPGTAVGKVSVELFRTNLRAKYPASL
jgi:hypothetical protein